MVFNHHVLSQPLSDYIEAIFHFKHFTPDHSIERVVPTGHLYIIFELDGMKRNTFDNESLKPNAEFTKVWISGMHRNYISISAHQDSEMFVIQFKSFGSYPFLHIPVEDLNEKVVPAEELLGSEIIELREKILEGTESTDKFSVAEEWLSKRFDVDKIPPQQLITVVDELQHATRNHYNGVLDKYSNSQKHLIDQFKKYVGLTPKYYQRILRFNELLKTIQNKESFSWAQVAVSCSYSDQAHFIKEFKHFSGFNPQEFIINDYNITEDPNFFPLDRNDN